MQNIAECGQYNEKKRERGACEGMQSVGGWTRPDDDDDEQQQQQQQ